MAPSSFLKPSHKAIKRYYQSLDEYRAHKVKHEGALETAFQRLLEAVGHSVGWRMTPKEILRIGNSNIFPDGTFAISTTPAAASGKPRTPTTTSIGKSPRKSPKVIRPATQSSRI